jgi:hypothetical protein
MVSKQRNRRRHSQIKSPSVKWPDKMKLSDARKFVGCSFAKITKLVEIGILPYESSALDRRVKLVRRSDLEDLLQRYSGS